MEKFLTVLDYLENEVDILWDYVEREGENSCRFDFNRGQFSLWINHLDGDVTAEGQYPPGIAEALNHLNVNTY